MIALQLSSKKSLTSKSGPEKWAELKSGQEIHVFFPHDNLLTGRFIQFKKDTINSLLTFSNQDSQQIFSSARFIKQKEKSSQSFSKDTSSGQEYSLHDLGIILKPELQQGTLISQDIKLYIPVNKIGQIKYHSIKWGWIALGITADAVCVYSAFLLLDKVPGIDWKISWPRWRWKPFKWGW
jgi:hypothetical protein